MIENVHYRILFLAMSCNDPFFVDSRRVTHDTWAKDIILGKYPNVGFFTYTASETGEEYIEDNTIYLNCGDGLKDTWDKTMKCLKYLENHNITYDYIVRTNTSNYFNVYLFLPKIRQFDKFNIDVEAYGINYEDEDSHKKKNQYAVFTGYYLLMSNKFTEGLKWFYDNQYKDINNKEDGWGIDDIVISWYIFATSYKTDGTKTNTWVTNLLNPLNLIRYKVISNNKLLLEKNPDNSPFISLRDPQIVNACPIINYRYRPVVQGKDNRYIELEHVYELHDSNQFKIY